MSSGKPRPSRSKAKVVDLRSDRIKKFRAIKRQARAKEKERKLRIKLGDGGKARWDELLAHLATAKAAIKTNPDLDDLDIRIHKHLNADGTFDVELRIADLPSYQDPDGALALLSEALPFAVGNGDVKISHGARFAFNAPEPEYDPTTGEEIITGLAELKARYRKATGRFQEQTYWRDASEPGKKVGSQFGAEKMLRAFADRDRRVDTVFVRYHWSPQK